MTHFDLLIFILKKNTNIKLIHQRIRSSFVDIISSSIDDCELVRDRSVIDGQITDFISSSSGRSNGAGSELSSGIRRITTSRNLIQIKKTNFFIYTSISRLHI
jgi:hypothetical protein